MGNGLIVEGNEGTRRLTLDRPERRNALTPALIEELTRALDAIDCDPAARVVVLSGAGASFCAGYDINQLNSPGTPDAGSERDRVEALCTRLRALRVPTVAQVHGVASGAGCDLAVSCDVRFAAEGARFAMPPARLGVLYSHQGLGRLVALVGPALAKEMLFSGEPVAADRALAAGLVNRVVPEERLADEVEEFARVVAANAPLTISASKRMIDGASAAESEELGRLVWASEDASEGPQAFRERRPPRFQGR